MRFRMWLRGPWGNPTIAGLFIIASWTAEFLLDSLLWGNIFMITAAVVAGVPIIRKAIQALRVGNIAIDLLVSVAACPFIRRTGTAAF